jgi:pimeloyl-ACP methyl ester carboxylesterase
VTERMIEANGVELCTESFGEPSDPAILLIQGIGASMLWWEDEFCRALAGEARFVIRYDHRDTGRSVTYAPGRPGYTGADLVADVMGVLDAYDLPAAHLVGVSAGGAFAQLLALDYPDRVLSLVLISTTAATPGDRGLPSPSAAFGDFLTTAEVDWSDQESVIDYLVDYSRVLAGNERPFDKQARDILVRSDVERAHDFAAVQNHNVMPDGDRVYGDLSSVAAPTLVIHGTADPMFPPQHGEALAAEIPDARLLLLPGAGHGVDRADWLTIVKAVVEHTASTSGRHG